MGKKRSLWLYCVVMVLLLLAGCGNGAVNTDGDINAEQSTHSKETLTIYSPATYRSAVQQVLSHINLAQTDFRVVWSEDLASADVVITDHLPLEDHSKYRVLNTQKLQVQGIEDLMVFTDQGTIGIPLFLQLDCFWYDQLIYDHNGIPAPQSLDSWQSCSLNGQHPVLCDQKDMCALFWSIVAPYYLEYGGSIDALSKGDFEPEVLEEALLVLENMRDHEVIKLSDQAWQAFAENQAAYWVTGVDSVATYYNHMINPSSWRPSVSFPFYAQERAVCVIRADVLAVRKTADTELADRFLELFFKQQTMADLSAHSRMPLACHIYYAPEAVPELSQVCYAVLSSPHVDVAQVPCVWGVGQPQQVYDLLQDFMSGTMDAAEAAEQMTQ